jgi:hypothetical protein
MIDCSQVNKKNTNTNNNINLNNNIPNETKIELFDFSKRKLQIGQWVDVRDTIDQWLEAQVIDLKDNMVYIHYNGWGTRWDEWIDMKSERIKPFRFHTKQNTFSNYQSPFPNTKPDANVNIVNNLPSRESFFDIFEDLGETFESANNLMREINNQRTGIVSDDESEENISRKQKDVYLLSKNLVPLLDRFGRTITDIGGYLNFNLRNNRLEDLDKNVFSNGSLNSNLKPFDRFEQQRVEMEDSLTRNRRETGTNNIPPINQLDRSISNQVIQYFI